MTSFILHKHSASDSDHVVQMPEGLKELMVDITREVLRDQPTNIYEYISDYLEAMLVTRENALVAEHTVDCILDCCFNISDLLQRTGISREKADKSANVIRGVFKAHIAKVERGCEEPETLKEKDILKRLVKEIGLTEKEAIKAKEIIDVSFNNYFYRKIDVQKKLRLASKCCWKDSAERTLYIYNKSKPSQSEISRAAVTIQSAYRGYYERRMKKRGN